MTSDRRAFLRKTGIVASGGLFGLSNGAGRAAGNRDEGVTVAGRVASFGVPVTDATLTFERGDGSRSEREPDDRGRYEHSLEPGVYTVTVRAAGYADERRTIAVDGDESLTVDVDLEREWGPGEGDIDVYATGIGGGRTIPCQITVYGDRRYHSPAPLGSIPDGENWTRGFVVSEGWWEVLVTDADGYDDGYEEVYVGNGEEAFAHVELAEGDDEIPIGGTLTGRVADEDGASITNAWVTVGGRLVPVDDDGAFALELENGHYDVTTSAAGYETTRGQIRVGFGGETSLSVTLRASDEE